VPAGHARVASSCKNASESLIQFLLTYEMISCIQGLFRKLNRDHESLLISL